MHKLCSITRLFKVSFRIRARKRAEKATEEGKEKETKQTLCFNAFFRSWRCYRRIWLWFRKGHACNARYAWCASNGWWSNAYGWWKSSKTDQARFRLGRFRIKTWICLIDATTRKILMICPTFYLFKFLFCKHCLLFYRKQATQQSNCYHSVPFSDHNKLFITLDKSVFKTKKSFATDRPVMRQTMTIWVVYSIVRHPWNFVFNYYLQQWKLKRLQGWQWCWWLYYDWQLKDVACIIIMTFSVMLVSFSMWRIGHDNPKLVTYILNLSPTHFVSNIRYQIGVTLTIESLLACWNLGI